MKLLFPAVVLLLPLLLRSSSGQDDVAEKVAEAISAAFGQLEGRIDEMKTHFSNLARQVMLQQFNSEQRIRTDGQSGIKTIRNSRYGTKNYHAASHLDRRFIAMHDHADNLWTVGLGEFNAVINGVEFTTRHNDYKLVMPSTTSTEYHATEPLPWPEVPPSVNELEDVNDQIKELRTYFQAFATQNTTLRDYRPYFKPVLCYMEGAWTLDKDIDEPFSSDRHHLDASSWMELQNLVRYNSYTGIKNALENIAHLPTTIMHVNSTTGEPLFAQWNYRILCNPAGEDIPTKYLRQIEDMKYSYPKNKVSTEYRNNRAARFVLSEKEGVVPYKDSLLDRIFYRVPGKDNQPSNLSLASYDDMLFIPGSVPRKLQDTSMYTRASQLGAKDAMGNTFLLRGFNEPNMWCAETTQPRVAPLYLDYCKKRRRKGQWVRTDDCWLTETRFSWAIPLEIIYMTPLISWNPFNIPIRERSPDVYEGGRDGQSQEKALNGSSKVRFYRTPVNFFQGDIPTEDAADTASKGGMWMMGEDGSTHKCAASGQRVVTPYIEGVGNVRLRYPIAPIHGEQSGVWQELTALEDFVKDQSTIKADQAKTVDFTMSTTYKDPPGEHTHVFTLTAYDVKRMRDDKQHLTVTTTQAAGHTHTLVIRYRGRKYEYYKCDNVQGRCRTGTKRKSFLIQRLLRKYNYGMVGVTDRHYHSTIRGSR